MRYVVDASVLVAGTQHREPHYTEARTLLDRLAAEMHSVLLPVTVLAEVSAAIARATGNRALAQRFVSTLIQFPHFEFAIVDQELALRAADLAAEYRLRGYDSVYVALTAMRSATLVTLDREQGERVQSVIRTRTPAEAIQELDAGV